MVCDLHYIPDYLHSNGRPIVAKFDIGEELYYRTNPDRLERPYDNISLRDISHNRSFIPKVGSTDDVLFNILPDEPEQRYNTKSIVTLMIRNLGEHETFSKTYTTRYQDDISVGLTLKHDPVPCMYPHSVFEIKYNGIIVTQANYAETIGKRKNKACIDLREQIRNELSAMLLNGEIDSTQEFEEVVL